MNIWSSFPRANCLPNNCGCEFVHLDQLIAQPSAFWSSLFHIIFAILLYTQTKHKSQRLKLWILSVILLGLSSHFAHGSFLEFAMAMDFAGIVLVMSFFTLYKWLVKWVSSTPKLVFLLLSYQGGLWMTFYSLEKWFKVGLCVVIFTISIVELLHSEGKAFLKARDLHIALVILVLSFALFMIDELRLICDPHSWITGHSIWHLGTALSLYYYGKWRLR
jgi:hypothetical protein